MNYTQKFPLINHEVKNKIENNWFEYEQEVTQYIEVIDEQIHHYNDFISELWQLLIQKYNSNPNNTEIREIKEIVRCFAIHKDNNIKLNNEQ